jgi:hypothetical protein
MFLLHARWFSFRSVFHSVLLVLLTVSDWLIWVIATARKNPANAFTPGMLALRLSASGLGFAIL